MREFFSEFFVHLMAIVLTIFGVMLFNYWLVNELSILNCIIGFCGYLIGIRPTVEYWIEQAKKTYKDE
jgi:hypothetical protein